MAEQDKMYRLYRKKTKGMPQMTKEEYIRFHYPTERYTLAKNRTEAIGNMARSGNAITAEELERFTKPRKR